MKMFITALGLAFTFALVAPAITSTPFSANLAFAKNGADDGPGHDVGDDRGGRGRGGKGGGGGADDGAGHR